MITGYIQADLKNPIVHKYLEHSLKSFERVKDVFNIQIIQCIVPDEILWDDNNKKLLDKNSFDPSKGRSPQEIASLMSQYRLHRRLANGERFYIMEHDAYLHPEEELSFRRILEKFHTHFVNNIGIAMECYTSCPDISKMFCEKVENDFAHKDRGPMTILHNCTDQYVKDKPKVHNQVWWPRQGMENKTGISWNVSTAFRNPNNEINAPVTQLVDGSIGSTVTDRPGVKPKYTPQSHPNFKFVTLDF